MHRLGLRFRVQADLPGTPDIALMKAKIAIFVDGCFWHRCSEHAVAPKNNSEWWDAKLSRNVERDRAKDRALLDMGWCPVHVWEHEDPVVAAGRIREMWFDAVVGVQRPPQTVSEGCETLKGTSNRNPTEGTYRDSGA